MNDRRIVVSGCALLTIVFPDSTLSSAKVITGLAGAVVFSAKVTEAEGGLILPGIGFRDGNGIGFWRQCRRRKPSFRYRLPLRVDHYCHYCRE